MTALLPFLLSCPAAALPGDGPVIDWEVSMATPALSSAVDSGSNMIVGELARTTKLSPDGVELWSRPFDLAGGHTLLTWTAVDGQDNVVRGGYHEATGGGFLAVKYDPAGNELWHSLASFGAGPEARRVAVDENGDVYVFGETWGGLDGSQATGRDLLTVKFDANGVYRWARIANGSGSDEPTSMAVRGGRVAVTGRANGRFLTACYDYAGNVLWQRLYTDGIYGSNDVVIGAQGQVVVCGWGTTNGTYPYTGTVVQYDASGIEDWRAYHNSPGAYVDNFLRLGIDDAGEVTAVGWTSVTAYEDWSIVRISPTGTVLWSAQHDGIGYQSEWARSLELGPDGEVYVGGNAGPTCTGIGTEGVLQKYTADGTLEWTWHDDCGSYPRWLELAPDGALFDTTNYLQVLRLDVDGDTDGPYCDPANANSTGLPAVHTVLGTASFANGDLRFRCEQLPTNTLGLFFHGDERLIPGFPFGDGYLCATGNIARHGVVQASGGSVEQPQDLNHASYAGLQPGDAIYTQFWYRDPAAGASGFNLSDAYQTTLTP